MDFSTKLSPRCPIRTAQDLLGGKWKLLIIYQLKDGPLRPSELLRQIPDISEKMLTQELRHLVVNLLVERKNYGEVPPRVEYSLTANGRLALPLVEAMQKFSELYETQGS